MEQEGVEGASIEDERTLQEEGDKLRKPMETAGQASLRRGMGSTSKEERSSWLSVSKNK